MYDDEMNETDNLDDFVRPPQADQTTPHIFEQEAPETPPVPAPASPVAQPAETPEIQSASHSPQPAAPESQEAPPATPDTAQPAYSQPDPKAGQGGYAGVGYAGQQGYGQPGYTPPGYTPPGYTPPRTYAGPTYVPPGYARPSYAQTPPQPPIPVKKPKKERKSNLSTAALVVIIAICCAASGVGGGLIGANVNGGGAIPAVGDGNNMTINAVSEDITVTEAVAKKVLSSVVGIRSTGKIVNEDYFFGAREEEVEGVGSGMVLDTQGYILTNSHVVMDGTVNNITVVLSTGEEVAGRVIWNDASLDLAIVKIEAEGLSPVELGNSDEVAIGSYVAAIGNPLGLAFNGSITQGVVSGLNRTITVSDEMGGNVVTMDELIQVDAAINPGNSGGPLLNSKGQVIGVNSAKAQAEGMGFAIPINTAIPIIEKVIRDGSFERVYMGVSAANVEVIKENYPNVEILADRGAVLTDVNPGSPAERAGLKVKDVITSVDEHEIDGSSQLVKLLLGYESGDTIKVTYLRDGEEQKTDLTLVSASELNKIQEEENPFRDSPGENNR
ncbi:hypothetical protein AGMMS49983_18330 [Clostridia bacterium]|nr:hypothetical protein AGMMS49983_18330 [Clostridia bacterium]